MQITRPRGDSRIIAVEPSEPLPEPFMQNIQIWAFPQASDLSPRRLINCANLITSLGNDADQLRRYVCALDIRENDSNHGLFSKMEQYPAVNELLKSLSPSQLGAFNYVKDIKHPIALIQGPPGTGKTTFIVTFLQILSIMGHVWIACAPSNSATDHMATVFETKSPQLGAIRFHSYDNEARAIRKQERDLVDRSEDAPIQEEDSAAAAQSETILQEEDSTSRVKPADDNEHLPPVPNSDSIRQEEKDSASPVMPADDNEHGDELGDETTGQAQPKSSDEALNRRLFDSYIADLQNKDVEWKGKMGRPNFKDMGLNIRALQNAGVVQHDIPCFAPTSNDPHAEFRNALKNRDFGRDKTDEEKSRYKEIEEHLMIDTLHKTCGIITTLSKTADNKLKKGKKPVVAIIDEACQSTELETLLVWAHNTETLVLIIFIGDPKQLPGTVKTLFQNTADNLVNPFAKQMIVSLFERLWSRGFPSYMFYEQYRLASGLEEVFNHLFYDGKIVNAEGTKLEHRPGAQAAIDYIHKTYGVKHGIPHVCLNDMDGVCLRGALQSRYNPQNIAATTHAIVSMIDQGLWTEEEISVITPYREQAALYRKVFRKIGYYGLQVYTADSVQGRENKCTIFDIVLAFARIGGWAFVKEGLRLTFAISRSTDPLLNHSLVLTLIMIPVKIRERVRWCDSGRTRAQ